MQIEFESESGGPAEEARGAPELPDWPTHWGNQRIVATKSVYSARLPMYR